MGQKYLVERSIEDITQKLLTPAPLDDETKITSDHEDNEEDRVPSPPVEELKRETNASKAGKSSTSPPPEVTGTGDGEEEGEEEQKEEWPADIVENDYL